MKSVFLTNQFRATPNLAMRINILFSLSRFIGNRFPRHKWGQIKSAKRVGHSVSRYSGTQILLLI